MTTPEPRPPDPAPPPGPQLCVCGHRKDPDGEEPGHRDGVCQAIVVTATSRMPCGCDGYEKPEPMKRNLGGKHG